MRNLMTFLSVLSFSITCLAKDTPRENLKLAAGFVSQIVFSASAAKMLLEKGETKAACLILREHGATGFGFYAQTYQIAAEQSWSLKSLPIDVGNEELNLQCRINLLQSYCKDDSLKEIYNNTGAYDNGRTCTERLNLKMPKSADDFSNQSLLLVKEGKRLLGILEP